MYSNLGLTCRETLPLNEFGIGISYFEVFVTFLTAKCKNFMRAASGETIPLRLEQCFVVCTYNLNFMAKCIFKRIPDNVMSVVCTAKQRTKQLKREYLKNIFLKKTTIPT